MSQAKEVIICEANVADAERVLSTLNTILRETDYIIESQPLSLDDMVSFIADRQNRPNELCLIAKIDSEVIGILNIASSTLYQMDHIGDLFIAIKERYVGNGLGQAMVDMAIDWSKQSDIIRRLELTVQKRNKRAIHVYEKFGFEIEGTKERGIKTKNGEFLDLYLMSKMID